MVVIRGGSVGMDEMTEDEAKTKWCPFAQTVISDGNAGNRLSYGTPRFSVGEITADTRCLGSGCMAWRWQNRTDGHCGLAGRLD